MEKTIKLYSKTPDFVPEYEQPEPYMTPRFLEGKGHTCVIVCPGGAYLGRAETYEGIDICDWFNTFGVSAVMLSYRVAPYRQPVEQNDLSAAVQYIRTHSDELGIAPHKIGVMGFSAGAHLAASVLTHPERFERPDFGILCYGVLSFQDDITHKGTRISLLGDNITKELCDYYSAELNVTKDTPPCFLFHTRQDDLVPFDNSVRFYNAMKKAGIPCEMRLFDKGNHGVGLAAGIKETEKWPEYCKEWVKHI